MNFDQDDLEPS